MIKAEWILDYNFRADKNYQRPGCPECNAPVGKYDDGKYRCYSCGEKVSVDKDMDEWLAAREETKIEIEDCEMVLGCGGKNCVRTLYRRNPVTMEWEVAMSECENCGQKIIV